VVEKRYVETDKVVMGQKVWEKLFQIIRGMCFFDWLVGNYNDIYRLHSYFWSIVLYHDNMKH